MKKKDRKTIFNISIIVSGIGIIISLLIAILLGYDYKNLVYPLTAICPVLIFLMIPVTLVFLELFIYKWSNDNTNKKILIITIVLFIFTIILSVVTPKINQYIQNNKIMYIEKNDNKEKETKQDSKKENNTSKQENNKKSNETTEKEQNNTTNETENNKNDDMDLIRKCTVMEAADLYTTGGAKPGENVFDKGRETCLLWYKEWDEKDFVEAVTEDWKNRQNEEIDGKPLSYYLDILGW